MDIMYLPDSIAYQTRMYGWGRDEQAWVNVNEKPDKNTKREKSTCTVDEKNCSICKNRQKRTLSNYIRKARKDSDKATCIEEEEEDNEQETQAKGPCGANVMQKS